jgi:PadR family transcriptional regulator, regulatory protein AphA
MSLPTPDETLLGLLISFPQHGYQLLETFQDPNALGRVWKLSTSQLYAVLKRLNDQGFITGEEAFSADAPPRTIYNITASGEAYLQRWLEELKPSPSVRRVRVECLSRLYVARLLNRSISDILQHQKATCEQKYQQLAVQRQPGDNSTGSLALELEIAQMQAVLGWLTQMELTSI